MKNLIPETHALAQVSAFKAQNEALVIERGPALSKAKVYMFRLLSAFSSARGV